MTYYYQDPNHNVYPYEYGYDSNHDNNEYKLYLGNGRGFVTPEGLRVRVPEGKGGGLYILTLIPLYPWPGVRNITLAS